MTLIERSPNIVRVVNEVRRRVSVLEQNAGQAKTVSYKPSDLTGITTSGKTLATVDLLAGQDAILECYIKATGNLTRSSGSGNLDIRVTIDGTQVFPGSINGAVLIWNSTGSSTLRTQHGTAFGVSTRPGGFVTIEQDSGVVLDPGLRVIEFKAITSAAGATATLSDTIIALRCS